MNSIVMVTIANTSERVRMAIHPTGRLSTPTTIPISGSISNGV